jgi:hypothetical protein
MDWRLFAQLLATFFVAALGWWAAHSLSARRDLSNERRKLRVQYLLEAYRRLEDSANRGEVSSQQGKLESAIADIQLLGSPHQVTLAQQFAQRMATDGTALADELLSDLRDSLRNELHLESVSGPIGYLRLKSDR